MSYEGNLELLVLSLNRIQLEMLRKGFSLRKYTVCNHEESFSLMKEGKGLELELKSRRYSLPILRPGEKERIHTKYETLVISKRFI